MTEPTSTPYPVTIRGDLTEPISRWLFLVKWLLIIPHLVVLFFLYIGFIVSWVISLFAILFTGKYPRGLFDYNVGVQRWGWRVFFYSYNALGTDKYPPFTLKTRDDYPADLYVRYPEKLSRRLVLVKWWLLLIPHTLVVALFASGSSFQYPLWGAAIWSVALPGLLATLLLFLAVANLFTGKYPKDIWVLVMGINRWICRVGGYTALMTDKYPPFRLGE
ncbi:MAG: DUF4389 domain-containing protein [Chloroflexota bacterium]|nr:DUF4389 domain-containing protein [Chloroflexota bacterium]